jgi:hypothetical protein
MNAFASAGLVLAVMMAATLAAKLLSLTAEPARLTTALEK